MPIFDRRVEVVGPDRDIAGDIGHVVVNAGVPAQRGNRQDVPEAPHRVADAVGAREWERSQWSRQRAGERSRQRRADAAIQSDRAHGCLAAENRRGECVDRQGPAEIGPGIEVGAQVGVEIDGDFADRDLARPRYVGSGRYAGMIIDCLQGPARLQGGRRQTPKEAGDPEAHAAFIGKRRLRNKRECGGQGAGRDTPCEVRAARSRCGLRCGPRCRAFHVSPPAFCYPRNRQKAPPRKRPTAPMMNA